METNSHLFHLKVQKIEQICLFELSWGQGQTLTAQVNYPNTLTRLYQEWRHAYLSFYQSDLRGRAVNGGVVTITVDWHAELIKAETKLMYEFHRWLRSGELYDIRATIAQTNQELVKANPNPTQALQVLLTCKPIELERFPWEAWELGTEFATTAAIQIIRAPLNIKADTTSHSKKNRRRARILVIWGDETGLNFQADKEAVQSLHRFAEVKFAGWQPNKTSAQVIREISEAIASKEGWDILFFAGHSNESDMTGGELGIAPGVSISISEIVAQLTTAKKRGLQVAIFNSCSGLSIADALIDLGFSQVVVMREPIHNHVAQEFLVRFLLGLAKHLDIYESVMEARQFLRMEKSHTYPSAYLVPSLFCHPGGKLFRILPFDWKQRLRRSLPSLVEAIAQKPPKNGKLDKLLQWHSPFGLPPLVDYSIPPKQVYTKIPAWQLLENPDIKKFPSISQQIVLIAVGDDDRLGMSSAQPDHSKAPSAMTYWTHQNSLTGGESLAYMTHHFIKQHLVVPIPDLWMVMVAVILGKASVFTLRQKSSLSTSRLLIIVTSLGVVTIYGVAAAQIYVSTTILLPWFLPTAVFLAYIFSFKTKENHV